MATPGPKLPLRLYVGAWAPPYVLYAMGMRYGGGASSFPEACLRAATYLLPGALIGIVAWAIARRIAWKRWRGARFFALEAALVAGYSVVWELVFVGILYLLSNAETVRAVAPQAVGFGFLFNLLMYGMQDTIFHVVRISQALREKERAAAEADRLRIRAEMDALRAQLNPHFLFNTLHSITALVRYDPKRAEDALLQFGALLRRVLDLRREGADEVSLAEEMRFVDDYLAIEQLRLGDRLRVERDLAAGALDCLLPTFSVQALVENAIVHAIAPRRDGGRIRIGADVKAGRLVVTVADDGPGADLGALSPSSGVGLSVVRQRLRVLHEDAGQLHIVTQPGHGFTARLELPARDDNGTDATEIPPGTPMTTAGS